jgi:hypothetical protein
LRPIVSTVKKSVARIPAACDRRNWGPCWAGPAGSWVEPAAEQDRPDRRRGDPDPELQQLPADPLVPPAWVLPAEADDEVPDIGVDRRPSGLTSPPIRPLLPDEFPVPAQQGLRPHDERGPAAPRQSPARRGQQDPVETVEPRTRHLPLEHLHLVPEHEELDVVLILSATSDSKETADQEIQE